MYIFILPCNSHIVKKENIAYFTGGEAQPSAFPGAALCLTPIFVPVSDIRSCKCAGVFKKHSGKTATRSAWLAKRCSNKRSFPNFENSCALTASNILQSHKNRRETKGRSGKSRRLSRYLQYNILAGAYTCNRKVISLKIKNKRLAVCIAVPLVVGAVSGFITRNSMSVFRQLKKPPFSPPGWVFPIVWTIIFVLMGAASYLVITARQTRQQTKAILAYIAQLIVNFFWPIFFFRFKWYSFSFIWLVILWALILLMIRYFYRVSKKAAYLLIPYLIWITYAGYLNLFISLLN